ncbi:MAG: sulfurase [Pseudomonadota bacterium]
MAILTPSGLTATVAWCGLVREQESGIDAEPVEALALDWGGPVGDVHHGLTRPACVRVQKQYRRNTEIRNVRQLSIVSLEDLATIAGRLGIPRVAPEWLGATVAVEGLPAFTLVPPGSRLIGVAADGTRLAEAPGLVVDMENAPCRYPAEEIEKHHPGHGAAFAKVARGLRGITAWVERPGRLAVGDRLALHVPPQRPYPGLAPAG